LKAVECTRYGPPNVLRLKEIEKPTPKNNEVLVKVHAATVLMGDCELRGMKLPLSWQLIARIGFGFRGPRKKILGQELAGEIEAVGKDVSKFKTGDQVFANTGLHLGAYAEYDCLAETELIATKPENMTFEEAASVVVGGLHSLFFLRKASIRQGQKVLIAGAGGSIGTIAVQYAKSLGAEVTSVDSAGKLDKLHSIGADHVIDYSKEDFTKNGENYDVIFDVVGKCSFSGSMHSLSNGGYYLLGNPGAATQMHRLFTSKKNGKKVVGGSMVYKPEDLLFLKGLIEAGKIRSVTDRSYPLEQIVEAHKYVETGLKIGSVVITV